MWDVFLTTPQTTLLEECHAHLMPFLHITSNRDAANCEVGYSDTGHPLVIASQDLADGKWLVLYLGMVNGPEEAGQSDVDSVPVDTEELLKAHRPIISNNCN